MRSSDGDHGLGLMSHPLANRSGHLEEYLASVCPGKEGVLSGLISAKFFCNAASRRHRHNSISTSDWRPRHSGMLSAYETLPN